MGKWVISLAGWYLAQQRSAREEIHRRLASLPWLLLALVLLMTGVAFAGLAGFLALQMLGYSALLASLMVAGVALLLLGLCVWRISCLWQSRKPDGASVLGATAGFAGLAEELLQSFIEGANHAGEAKKQQASAPPEGSL